MMHNKNKDNATAYIAVLDTGDVMNREVAIRILYVFQQDSASPLCIVHAIQAWLAENFHDHAASKTMSNTLEYYVWGVAEKQTA